MFFSKNKNNLSTIKQKFIVFFGENQYTQLIIDNLLKYDIIFDMNSNITIEQIFLKEFGTQYLVTILDKYTFEKLSILFEKDTIDFISHYLSQYSLLYVSGIQDIKIENSDLLNKPLKDKLFSKIRGTINNVPSKKEIIIGFKIANKIEKLDNGDINFINNLTNYIFEPNLMTSKNIDNKNNYYFMDKIILLKEIYNYINKIYSKREQRYFQIFIVTETDNKTTPPQIFEEIQKAA